MTSLFLHDNIYWSWHKSFDEPVMNYDIYMFIYIQGKFKSKCEVANKGTLYPYPWKHGDVYNMFGKQINWIKNITWLYFVSKVFTYSY